MFEQALAIFTKLNNIERAHNYLKMTSSSQTVKENTQTNEKETTTEKVLCPHCLRTATNGLKCKGICVADDDY